MCIDLSIIILNHVTMIMSICKGKRLVFRIIVCLVIVIVNITIKMIVLIIAAIVKLLSNQLHVINRVLKPISYLLVKLLSCGLPLDLLEQFLLATLEIHVRENLLVVTSSSFVEIVHVQLTNE